MPPIDLVQMNLFYNENFDEHPSVVVIKFCKYHDLDGSSTLEHYRKGLQYLSNTNPKRKTLQ